MAGPATFALRSDSVSIASGEEFAFTAIAQVPEGTDSVTMRFQLKHPTGKLIFQRTRIVNEPTSRRVEEPFSRETGDLSLRPGLYPVTLAASARIDGTVHETVVESFLLVFDPDATAVPVVFVARISGAPLSDSQGRFVSDPGRFTRTLDEAGSLASWVIANPWARITVAIPPLLLEEWVRIAGGFELVGPEGVEDVSADSAVAREYAATLGLLTAAIETGRLELAAIGFADPDIRGLESAGLTDDLVAHYESGLSSTFASLKTSPSTGTVPAGGCLPEKAAHALETAGIGYAVVDADCVRSKETSVAPSSYRVVGSGVVALVSDAGVSQAVASGDAALLVDSAFRRLLSGSTGPLTISVVLGPGSSDAAKLIACATSLAPHRWVSMRTGREAASRPKRTVKLVERGPKGSAPDGYWADVADARRWAGALRAAIGDAAAETVIAERSSLIAASSTWAGADDGWVLADRGRTFADTATRLGREVLSKVTASVEPITLAGTAGDLPVTISNDSGRALDVRMVARTSKGVTVQGSDSVTMTLDPQDNFVKIPIALSNVVEGEVRVAVLAGAVELSSKTVTVRASYLDRIALVGGIVLMMIGVLVFIIRRVRAQEAAMDATSSGERYTDRDRRSSTVTEKGFR